MKIMRHCYLILLSLLLCSSAWSQNEEGKVEVSIVYVNSGDPELDSESQDIAAGVVQVLNEGTESFAYNLVIVDSKDDLNDFGQQTSSDIYVIAHGEYEEGCYTGNLATTPGAVADIEFYEDTRLQATFNCGMITNYDSETEEAGTISFADAGAAIAAINGGEFNPPSSDD